MPSVQTPVPEVVQISVLTAIGALNAVFVDQGTPYLCKQTDIDLVNTFYRFPETNLGPFIGPELAAQEVVEWNREFPSSSNNVSAAARIQDAIERIRQGHPWKPDLIIKMFTDLDLVFFGGKLRGNVWVTWVDADFIDKYQEGFSKMYGFTFRVPNHRCQSWIWLNATAIFESSHNSFVASWACVLHEMCHAYEIVRVRSRDASPASHGPNFDTMHDAIQRRSLAFFAGDTTKFLSHERDSSTATHGKGPESTTPSTNAIAAKGFTTQDEGLVKEIMKKVRHRVEMERLRLGQFALD